MAQDVFDKLKQAMIITSVLSLPDFSVPFVVETDALGFGMGVVLMQRSHPIAYFSKQFCPKLLRSPTYIHELHAITTRGLYVLALRGLHALTLGTSYPHR